MVEAEGAAPPPASGTIEVPALPSPRRSAVALARHAQRWKGAGRRSPTDLAPDRHHHVE